MLNTLVNKSSQIKLQLFYLLITDGNQTITEITDKLNISRRSLQRNVIDLNMEISDVLTNDEILEIEMDHGEIKLLGTNIATTATRTYHLIKQTYVSEMSSAFNIMSCLFESGTISLIKLAEKPSISESYIFKIVGEINSVLRQNKIAVNLKVQDRTISFTGSEIQIRILMYFMYRFAYSGSGEWPFVTNKHSIIIAQQQQINSSYLKQSAPTQFKSDLLFAIHKIRYNLGNFIDELPDQIIQVVDLIDSPEETLLRKYLSKNNINQHPLSLATDIKYAIFINLFVTSSTTINEETVIKRGKLFYNHHEIPAIKLAITLIDQTMDFWQLKTKSNN